MMATAVALEKILKLPPLLPGGCALLGPLAEATLISLETQTLTKLHRIVSYLSI